MIRDKGNLKLGVIAFVVLFATLALSIGCASADTIYVPDDFAKIQWAVDNTTAGATIIVRDGTYEENVDVNKLLTIRSEKGSTNCIVQAMNPNDDVFDVTADASIIGLTIQGSNVYGIYASSSDLYVEDVAIRDNGNYGIHIYYGKNFTLKDCTIEDNGGGVLPTGYASGNAVAENNVIRNNAGYGLFIQLAQSKHATITNNQIDSNSEQGLRCYMTGLGGTATIKDNVISNSGTYGVVIYGVKDTVITNMTIDGVAGDDGLWLGYCSNMTIKEPFTIQNANRYGLYVTNSDLYAENIAIKNNVNYGIYFDNGKDFTLKNCTVENNGGGVTASGYATGDAIAENNVIRNNAGYGLFIQLAQSKHATITNNQIDSNSEQGLRCYMTGLGGTATIKDNVISNSGTYGVVIYGVKDTVITNTTIDGVAGDDGLWLGYCSNLTIKEPFTIQNADRYGIYTLYSDLYAEDVTIKNNGGYGIYFDNGKDFTLRNCTIKNNGGGVTSAGYATGNAVAENNIIRNNTGYGLVIQLAQLQHATVTNNQIDTNSREGLYCYITGVGGTATIKDNVISNSGSHGAYIYGVKNAAITNITIDGAGNDGLHLQSCSNISIKEPFAIQNAGRYGIYTLYSDLYAEDVTIKDNGGYGIYFDKGKDFTLRNCLIENNGGGVTASGYATGNAVAENNVIKDNTGYGLVIQLAQLQHATVTNNLIDTNSREGLYCYITGVGGMATIKDNVISNSGSHGAYIYGVKDAAITNITIDGAGNDGLHLQSCSNISIKEPFTIQNADRYGIYTLYSDLYAEDVTIKNNGGYGIYFDKGKDFTLRNCTIENNGGGVTSAGHATGNAVAENNIIRNNTGYGLVIQLAQLQHATVTNNLIDTNSREGLYCYITGVGGGATIKDNVITNSGSYGAYIYGVKDSVITKNTISKSYNQGIYLHSSSDNVIYLNNFNNNQNFYCPDSNNIWNSTQKISYTYRSKQYTNYMGNYWNDYTGSDTNDDGIGDTSYSIDSDRDNYPLMQQWENYFTSTSSVFDTGAGAYPSIQGTHEGKIKPSCDIEVSKMYTYPCAGTGGHAKSIEIYENDTLKASGNWSGYQHDWQNITITPAVTLKAGWEYRYVIETGSYPQIIHVQEYQAVTGGTITCDEFTDVNGKIYTDWIPAIKLWS